jgi:hypothetical protein
MMMDFWIKTVFNAIINVNNVKILSIVPNVRGFKDKIFHKENVFVMMVFMMMAWIIKIVWNVVINVKLV